MKTIELDDGAVAVIREARKFTNRQQNDLQAEIWETARVNEPQFEALAALVEGKTENPSRLAYDLSKSQLAVLLKYFVVSWTLADETGAVLPLPKDNPDVLDDLTVGDTETIGNAVAAEFSYFMPSFEETTLAGGDDPFTEAADTAASEPQPSSADGTESDTPTAGTATTSAS